jgi:hypothetical protein
MKKWWKNLEFSDKFVIIIGLPFGALALMIVLNKLGF